jgi:hypothetical protein
VPVGEEVAMRERCWLVLLVRRRRNHGLECVRLFRVQHSLYYRDGEDFQGMKHDFESGGSEEIRCCASSCRARGCLNRNPRFGIVEPVGETLASETALGDQKRCESLLATKRGMLKKRSRTRNSRTCYST